MECEIPRCDTELLGEETSQYGYEIREREQERSRERERQRQRGGKEYNSGDKQVVDQVLIA